MRAELIQRERELVIIGIAVRITPATAAGVMREAWDRFMRDDAAGKVPARVGHDLYGAYYDYEGEYRAGAPASGCTALIGVASTAAAAPAGYARVVVPPGKYARFVVPGDPRTAVGPAWQQIGEHWADQGAGAPRAFRVDFEQFGSGDGPTEIYVGVR